MKYSLIAVMALVLLSTGCATTTSGGSINRTQYEITEIDYATGETITCERTTEEQKTCPR